MIAINLFYSSRDFVLPISLEGFLGISEENKKKIHINMLCCQVGQTELNYCQRLADAGISVEAVHNKSGSYMDKVRYAANFPSTYSIKADEDTWTSPAVWNYWIENINILDNFDCLTFSPLLSAGIPTVDRYVELLFSEEEQNEVYNLFKAEQFPPNINGADYRPLNQHTVENGGPWNANNYYRSVAQLNHYYKGIHPMRQSRAAQLRINELTIKHKKEFMNPHGFAVWRSLYPYLCPQLYSIKTSQWKEIINRKELFADQWDEVPINRIKEQENLRHYFIDGGFGIHIIYNWVGNRNDEVDFVRRWLNA